MKRMLTLSLAIHLAAGMLFVFLAWIGERRIESSIYTVNLITPAPELKSAAPEPKGERVPITPAPEVKREAPEPKREQAPKITKPLKVKPAPPKNVVKRPPVNLSMLERQISKLEAAHQKQVPPPEPTKQTVQPSPSPAVPETAPSSPSQQSPAPGSSEEAAVHPPVATAAMEVPHFKFPFYQAQIERKISIRWSPPPLTGGSEGEVTIVSFQLSRSGRVQDVQIEKRSGNSYYDQAALRAIYEADPLPPWPQGLRETSLKIYFRFELAKKSREGMD